jgi:LmbE family N-acetylglucosaminyl deacetylase
MESNKMWIYLSPHYDDAALSAGGLIWEQARAGQRVEVWTICGGEPDAGTPLSPFASELHQRWEAGPRPVSTRRREDRAACRVLGAKPRNMQVPDSIYRYTAAGEPVIRQEADLWAAPLDEDLVAALAARLRQKLPVRARVVCPLGLGGHIDHRLTRAAAERLGRQLYYYPDYPYVIGEAREGDNSPQHDWERVNWVNTPQGLRAWQAAIAAHRSQISSFWAGEDEMRAAIAAYWSRGGGASLWKGK